MPRKIWQDQEAIFLKKWNKDVFIKQERNVPLSFFAFVLRMYVIEILAIIADFACIFRSP